jgi:hypothetical protein
MKDLSELATHLQRDLAQVDLLTRPSRSSGRFLELLIVKLDKLKLKIYQEPGHKLPHIHVDYGNKSHAASYGIDPVIRLAGDLPSKYERPVTSWIDKNKSSLLELWNKVQDGGDPSALVIELKGDT